VNLNGADVTNYTSLLFSFVERGVIFRKPLRDPLLLTSFASRELDRLSPFFFVFQHGEASPFNTRRVLFLACGWGTLFHAFWGPCYCLIIRAVFPILSPLLCASKSFVIFTLILPPRQPCESRRSSPPSRFFSRHLTRWRIFLNSRLTRLIRRN